MEYVSRYQSAGSMLVSAVVLGVSVLFGSLFLAPSAARAAAPTTFTVSFQDANSDGSIDRLIAIVNGGEVLSACTVDAGEIATDWSVTGGGYAPLSLISATCDVNTGEITFVITAIADVTGGVAVPSLSYDNDDGDNSIANASGNLGAVGPIASTDAAKPAIITAATSDNDSNGTVDRLALTFSESVTITDGGTDNDITLVASSGTAAITAGTYGATASTLTYTVTPSVSNNTSLTITPTYATAGAGSIVDASGNEMLNAETVTGTDGAKPAILSAVTGDNNVDGSIDRLALTFSESVTITDGGTDSDITLVASSGTAAITAGTYGATASTLTYTITTSVTEDTSLTITPTYATAGAGSIVDASANEMLNTETVTGTDGAGPVLISASPTSLRTGVRSTSSVVLTFSETPASITTSHSPSVTLTSSINSSVVTLTHAAIFLTGLNTLTISTAPDAAANAFAGAQAGDTTVASPLTFYVTSSGDDDNDNDTSYSVNVLTPEADASFEAGASVEITWENGEGNASYANLYYSEDAGLTWETIVTNTLNDSAYTWTAPSLNSDNVIIKVITTDLADELASDTSAEFSLWYTADSETGGEAGVEEEEVEVVDVGAIVAGDYIKSETASTIYYIDASLMRRPFYDAQTFFTYEDDFDAVVTVADDEISAFMIGAPMMPKAGAVLVKIQSVAKVYLVEEAADGSYVLRWVTSEDIAEEMFGADWSSYIVDVDVTLFSRYEEGEDVEDAYEVDTDIMKLRTELHD